VIGKFTQEIELTTSEQNESSSFKELLAMSKFVEFTPPTLRRQLTIFIWFTDSQSVCRFQKKGSYHFKIQKEVLKINALEKKHNLIFLPIWLPRENYHIQLADLGSKIHKSIHEWGISEESYDKVLQHFTVIPTFDAFATQRNSKTTKYFSKIPQGNTFGIDFFTQNLKSSEVYWACPPVHLIQKVINYIKLFKTKILLHIPVRKKEDLLPLEKLKDHIISNFFIFKAKYYKENEHAMFDGYENFITLVVFLDTTTVYDKAQDPAHGIQKRIKALLCKYLSTSKTNKAIPIS